jgi:hypothetical protein
MNDVGGIDKATDNIPFHYFIIKLIIDIVFHGHPHQ